MALGRLTHHHCVEPLGFEFLQCLETVRCSLVGDAGVLNTCFDDLEPGQ